MRKLPLLLALALLLASCQQKKTLKEQLTTAFTNHLSTLQPNATLDSIRVIWNTPATERLGRIIDDSVYVREYNRIKDQLASATSKNDKDSMEFYRYEIAVLERGIDSVSKSIALGDTTRRYGSLLACAYYLTIDGKHLADSTLLFIDSTHVLRYTWVMDSSIAKTARHPANK